jgi:hypothetical protein
MSDLTLLLIVFLAAAIIALNMSGDQLADDARAESRARGMCWDCGGVDLAPDTGRCPNCGR